MGQYIQIRIDKEEKKQIKKILDSLGFTFSGAIKIFLRTLQKEKKLPFDVSIEDELNIRELSQMVPGKYKKIIRDNEQKNNTKKNLSNKTSLNQKKEVPSSPISKPESRTKETFSVFEDTAKINKNPDKSKEDKEIVQIKEKKPEKTEILPDLENTKTSTPKKISLFRTDNSKKFHFDETPTNRD